MPSLTLRVSLQAPCWGAHQPTPCVRPLMSLKTADVLDFLRLHPLALFGDGSGTVVGPLGDRTHHFNFVRILHKCLLKSLDITESILSLNTYIGKRKISSRPTRRETAIDIELFFTPLLRVSSGSEVGTSIRPLTWEYCSPTFPSGFPPPLGKSSVLLKCGICFSSFLIKFESRIEIIERRTVLTEHRSRGEEGDSTRTKPVST